MSNDISVRQATAIDISQLANIAERTFPLACPPDTASEDIQDFIQHSLSEVAFGEHMSSAGTDFYLAGVGESAAVGYSMLVDGSAGGPAVKGDDLIELRRIYVVAEAHGKGVGAALLESAEKRARGLGRSGIWLGTNQANHRAISFYRKHGFQQVGTRTFEVGTSVEQDFVMTKQLG